MVSNPGTEVFCPKCNCSDVYNFEDDFVEGSEWTHEYCCVECGHDFGKELNLVKSELKPKIRDRSHYMPCRAASGRKSCDNNDGIAVKLRGKLLDEVYLIVSDYLQVDVGVLKAKYSHLNNGQQRMCLGNKLRHHFKK